MKDESVSGLGLRHAEVRYHVTSSDEGGRGMGVRLRGQCDPFQSFHARKPSIIISHPLPFP